MANVTAKTSTDSFDGLTSTTAGNDVIIAGNGAANMGDVWNGGDGLDRLYLNAKFVNIDLSLAAISGIEELQAGKRNDRVTVSLQQFDSFARIDLGKGGDTLTLAVSGVADAGNAAFATLANVESLRLSGSTGADSLKISGSQLSGFASIAMLQGADVLNLTSTSANFNALGGADAGITGLESVSAAAAGAAVAISLAGQTEGFAIAGSAFADTLTGGGGGDVIAGGKGADVLAGGAGADTLDYSGSVAKVAINLGSGTAAGGDAAGDSYSGFENVTGGRQADTLTGDAGSNALSGGGGADLLQGGGGADHFIGGQGNDTVSYVNSAVGVTVNLLAGGGSGGDAEGDTFSGVESIKGSASADVLTGSSALNVIVSGAGNDTVHGLGGNDRIATANGNDQVDAGDGNDQVRGNGGDDTLAGGGGNDRIFGHTGVDILTGGEGADAFYFSSIAQAGRVNSADAITDFMSGFDKIGLAAMDADKTSAGNQAFVFIGDAAFSKDGGELRFNAATGAVEGDINGDGRADFAINIGVGTAISGADFLL